MGGDETLEEKLRFDGGLLISQAPLPVQCCLLLVSMNNTRQSTQKPIRCIHIICGPHIIYDGSKEIGKLDCHTDYLFHVIPNLVAHLQ